MASSIHQSSEGSSYERGSGRYIPLFLSNIFNMTYCHYFHFTLTAMPDSRRNAGRMGMAQGPTAQSDKLLVKHFPFNNNKIHAVLRKVYTFYKMKLFL
jgi:hypothetical protein